MIGWQATGAGVPTPALPAAGLTATTCLDQLVTVNGGNGIAITPFPVGVLTNHHCDGLAIRHSMHADPVPFLVQGPFVL